MKNKNFSAYNNELVALIKSGVKPEEAKKIADSHAGNYHQSVEQIATKRKKEKEMNKYQNEYARILSARINAGEKPEYVVKDMENF